MTKTIIILSVLVLILSDCSSNHNQKTAKEVSPEKLTNIPFHTTNHLVENEFPYNENFKPVLARVVFANETMGHCIVLERPQREIEEVINNKIISQ